MGFAKRAQDAERNHNGSASTPATDDPAGKPSGDASAPSGTSDGNQGAAQPATTTPASGSSAGAASPPSPYYYATPGNLNDLDGRNHLRAGWSALLDQQMDRILRERREGGIETHSYNPARETRSSASTVSIKWLAFPNNCIVNSDGDGDTYYHDADVRGNQDEYCEWEVVREGGELKSVTFTTEVPEYYGYLGGVGDEHQVLQQRYKSLNRDVADSITVDALLGDDGNYSKFNGWNVRNTARPDPVTDGRIAHLVRENNTLVDAAELVVDATILRKDEQGNFITDGGDLLRGLKVSKNSPNRNSDPNVVEFINNYVRDGKDVTLANPVGLYIDSFEHSHFVTNDGGSVSDLWRVERSSADGRYVVRASFTVPSSLLGKIKHEASGRKLEYGSQLAESIWIAAYLTVADRAEGAKPASEPSQPIYSYIEGRQIKPVPTAQSLVDAELRREPFGAYLASTANPAITLKDLIATWEDHTWAAFAADEGIGFYKDQVRVRMVLIWIPGFAVKPRGNTSSKMGDVEKLKESAFTRATVMVVALPPFDDKENIHSEKSILQMASFDPQLGWFNFYDRERQKPSRWLYFGSSRDALAPDTHGLGPFCGHPNGGLTIKEMERPWPHWHSSVAQLDLKPSHPLRDDPLFCDQKTGTWHFGFADHLATMVAKGTKQWFQTRRFLDFGPLTQPSPIAQRVHQWVAHVAMNTSVEIASSASRIPHDMANAEGGFKVPPNFFFDSGALGLVVDNVGVLAEKIHHVPWDKYQVAAAKLGLKSFIEFAPNVADDKVAVENEGCVSWKVVVPSAEDTEATRLLLKTGLLPRHIVTAVLMVDFWNPVFSPRRAQLMRYIPSTALLSPSPPPTPASSSDRYTLGADLVAAVERAIANNALPPSSPEAEFVGLARSADINAAASARLREYVAAVNARLATADGVLDYMRVAETRRRTFRPPPRSGRPNHPLAEFDLTLPYAVGMGGADGGGGEAWAMRRDGGVERVDAGNGGRSVWHPRDSTAHFSAVGCPFSQGV